LTLGHIIIYPIFALQWTTEHHRFIDLTGRVAKYRFVEKMCNTSSISPLIAAGPGNRCHTAFYCERRELRSASRPKMNSCTGGWMRLRNARDLILMELRLVEMWRDLFGGSAGR